MKHKFFEAGLTGLICPSDHSALVGASVMSLHPLVIFPLNLSWHQNHPGLILLPSNQFLDILLDIYSFPLWTGEQFLEPISDTLLGKSSAPLSWISAAKHPAHSNIKLFQWWQPLECATERLKDLVYYVLKSSTLFFPTYLYIYKQI